jgi:hypothetical protein
MMILLEYGPDIAAVIRFSATDQRPAWRRVAARGGAWRRVAARGGAWRRVAVRGGAWRCVAVRGGAWLAFTLTFSLAPG